MYSAAGTPHTRQFRGRPAAPPEAVSASWIRGQYGPIFDNAEDSLTFAAFQTFDFQGMDVSRK